VTITQSTDTATVPIEEEHDAPAPANPTDAPASDAADVALSAGEPEEIAASPSDAEPGASAPSAADPTRPRSRKATRRPSPPSAGASKDRRTTAQRLGNFPRAERPAAIPAPEHHHLPGWVRRDFARARPPLSNILALLEGDAHEHFNRRIVELNEGISSGKFSLAWQYPDLVDEGRALYEKQRRENAEGARVSRQLDGVRRRIQDRLRDAAESLPADVAARLSRQLRTASSQEELNAVTAELDGVVNVARSSAEKRREREIERTRERIRRTAAAAGAVAAEPQAETWQDVLRRFAEQQAAGSRAGD
jgi:hypothetical protein